MSSRKSFSKGSAKASCNIVGVGALDDPEIRLFPQARTFCKQIEQQPNDVRTEFCGYSLKLKLFAVPFRFRAELAERSNLRAAETV